MHNPADRERIHAILKPFWAEHKAWPQPYGVVFRILSGVRANGVSEDDIKRALTILGAQRKPISAGTIGFALATPAREQREEQVFEAAASARSASKYTQRTM